MYHNTSIYYGRHHLGFILLAVGAITQSRKCLGLELTLTLSLFLSLSFFLKQLTGIIVTTIRCNGALQRRVQGLVETYILLFVTIIVVISIVLIDAKHGENLILLLSGAYQHRRYLAKNKTSKLTYTAS